MDDNGKINGLTPIFNDLLAFIWNKMSNCPCEPLLKAVRNFYKTDDVTAARDLLYDKVECTERRTRHRKAEDMLMAIYKEFQCYPTDKGITFIAMNLNNMPSVNLSNIDAASLVHKQGLMSNSIEVILEENRVIKNELAEIKNFLMTLKTHSSVNPPDVNTENNAPPLPIDRPPVTRPQDNRINNLSLSTGNRNDPAREDRGNFVEHSGYSTESQNRNADNDSFTFQRSRRRNRNLVTVNRTGNSLAVVAAVRKCSVFVSRLGPDVSVDNVKEFANGIINDDCEVEKLNAKYSTYSSFKITCEDKYKTKILDPESWEKGVLIRPFYRDSTRQVPENTN